MLICLNEIPRNAIRFDIIIENKTKKHQIEIEFSVVNTMLAHVKSIAFIHCGISVIPRMRKRKRERDNGKKLAFRKILRMIDCGKIKG